MWPEDQTARYSSENLSNNWITLPVWVTPIKKDGTEGWRDMWNQRKRETRMRLKGMENIWGAQSTHACNKIFRCDPYIVEEIRTWMIQGHEGYTNNEWHARHWAMSESRRKRETNGYQAHKTKGPTGKTRDTGLYRWGEEYTCGWGTQNNWYIGDGKVLEARRIRTTYTRKGTRETRRRSWRETCRGTGGGERDEGHWETMETTFQGTREIGLKQRRRLKGNDR